MTSHSENDVREGYCGNCHNWTSPSALLSSIPIELKRRDPGEARVRMLASGIPADVVDAIMDSG